MRARFRTWISRHIIADDPGPEYSRLDRMDGLADYQPSSLIINPAAFNAWAQRHAGATK